MKLYEMGKAPNPRRVRMFLAEKGIDIDRIEVDIPSGANLTPDYLAINPRGLLPTLVLDDGTVIDESIAICRYFECLKPEPNLMGTTALEQAQIESWQRRMEFDGLMSIALAFRNSAPAFATRVAPGSMPSSTQIPELVARGKQFTQRFFDMLNARLAGSAYVAGPRFTIADITAYVCCDFARWVQEQPDDSHGALNAWRARIRERPSARA